MEILDGWAIAIGDTACRFFSHNRHEALQGLLCSDGSYSAGWKVLAVCIGGALMAFFLFRMVRPSN